MIDLSFLNNTLWLADPVGLQRAIGRVLSHTTCPGPRELATYRREALDYAAAAPARALVSTGVDDPAEMHASANGKAIRAVRGKVGVIAVHGPIQQRMTSELMKAGGTSTEEVQTALSALLADKSVEAIVFHCDSPGGSSYGTEELSDSIYAARAQKPCYAIADSMAASAAFWIATSADVLCCTPGGDVGSVGVYAMHIDRSQQMKEEGVKVSLVHAGKYKTEGNPFEELSEDAKANWQEMVNATYDRFVKALGRNRDCSLSDVRGKFGQGRLVRAQDAQAAGMVDRVLTFQQLLDKLTGGAGSPATRKMAADQVGVMKLRQEQRKRVGA